MKLFYLFLWGDQLNCVGIGTVSLMEHLHYENQDRGGGRGQGQREYNENRGRGQDNFSRGRRRPWENNDSNNCDQDNQD